MQHTDFDPNHLESQTPVVREKVLQFFGKGKAFSIPEKTTIIQADTKPDVIYFLTDGAVKQTTNTPAGNEIILNTFKSPAFFPLIQMMTGIPNRYTFVSLTTINGFTRPVADVEAFLRQEPTVLFDLTARLMSGLDAMLTKIELLMVETAAGRVEAALKNLAIRYAETGTKVKNSQFLPIPLPVTHQVLADMTGLTRETVTREIGHLSEAGTVKNEYGKLWIKIK